MNQIISKIQIWEERLPQSSMVFTFMTCLHCEGTGDDPHDMESCYPCPVCEGLGELPISQRPAWTAYLNKYQQN